MAQGLRLSPDERDTVVQERWVARKNKNQDLDLKLSCILAVADGRLQRDVAESFGVPLRTLEWWIRRYRTQASQGLVKGPYQGKKPRLSPEQKDELFSIIKAGPESVGLDTGVWNATVVVALIRTLFGVIYSICQAQRILNAIGFSVQIPRKRLSKEDKEKQQEWIEHRLPELKKRFGIPKECLYTRTKLPSCNPGPSLGHGV